MSTTQNTKQITETAKLKIWASAETLAKRLVFPTIRPRSGSEKADDDAIKVFLHNLNLTASVRKLGLPISEITLLS